MSPRTVSSSKISIAARRHALKGLLSSVPLKYIEVQIAVAHEQSRAPGRVFVLNVLTDALRPSMAKTERGQILTAFGYTGVSSKL
jgi:hypothetical protein